MKLQLKRSSTLVSGSAKPPLPSQLDFGELAINFNTSDPKIFFKDSSGAVVGLTDKYLELSGGTLTGDLVLNGDPTSNLMPATKQYTDSAITTLSNSIVYPVTSVNGSTGNVNLNYSNVGAPSATGLSATGTWDISITGSSATAASLSTGRNIALTGDVTGNANFNGTSNISINATVADDSHNHIISNIDGLQTALNAKQDAATASSNSLALNGKADTAFVQTTNNSSLNSDNRNTRGATRLYRRDSNTNYSIQTSYTGSRWLIEGYNGDTYHAGAEVAYAASAGSAATATTATSATTAATATDANNARIDHDTGNAWHRPVFIDDGKSSGTDNRLKTDNASTIGINPNSNQVRATTFVGALSGNATTATTATNATNFNVAADNSTNSNHYVIFTGGASGNQRPNSDTGLKWNPSTNTLTAANLNGNASTATTATTATSATSATTSTNVDVQGDNSTNFNRYLAFTSSSSGSTRIRTDTGLKYNPSTGEITTNKIKLDSGIILDHSSNYPRIYKGTLNSQLKVDAGGNSSGKAIFQISGGDVSILSWNTSGTIGFRNSADSSWLWYVTAYADVGGVRNLTTSGDVNCGGYLTVGTTFNMLGVGGNKELRFKTDGFGTVSFKHRSGATVTDTFLDSTENGSVKLYYNNSQKLQTTSSGITVTGSVSTTSDERLKKDIKIVENALDIVDKLNGVSFKYLEDENQSMGVVAQNIKEHLPDLVETYQGEDDNEYLSVNYNGLTSVLIEAIKELRQEINTLKGV